MAVFFSDDLAAADGTAITSSTPEVGTSWTNHTGAGNNTIHSNRVHGTGTANGTDYGNPAPSGADYEISGVFRQVTNVETMAIALRLTTAGATMYAAQRFSGDLWRLIKIVTGAVTSLGTYSDVLADGDERTIRLTVTGTSLELFVNGVSRITATDAAIAAAGRAGIRSTGGSSSTSIHVYNFSATETSGAAPVLNDLAHQPGFQPVLCM